MLLVTKLHRWLSFMLTNNYLLSKRHLMPRTPGCIEHHQKLATIFIQSGDNLPSQQVYRTSSNLLEPEIARCVELFHMSSGWFNSTEPSLTTSPCTPCFHCKDVVREGSVQSNHPELMCENSTHLAISAMIWFEKVRGGSMHLNHPELVHKHPCYLCSDVVREGSKRFCKPCFRVVRLYRTFSNNIFTGEARCAGCLCTSSGWFKYIEPPQTFSNHIIAEIARCVEYSHMSSGWFDCTALEARCAGCLCTSSGWFKYIDLLKPFEPEIARCVKLFHMSLGWFNCTEPSLTTPCFPCKD